ncbi:LOW QUALITY PROTEIN: E3 ubiquitin-protein ligase RBBP6-like [Rissa tridactyla]|uniref:LOW QUALITY PROTEIN: E3 ubiquitin-protein ligase RBBP6-like n=1 Tax=Rissa tridactyla TaxID=75485 RepID=UPI0023BAB466|nr:LOW QUALITY PROTEIN: E3 ubiquitin-protein ligase RBBP6-like [Rissa tridactyla]
MRSDAPIGRIAACPPIGRIASPGVEHSGDWQRELANGAALPKEEGAGGGAAVANGWAGQGENGSPLEMGAGEPGRKVGPGGRVVGRAGPTGPLRGRGSPSAARQENPARLIPLAAQIDDSPAPLSLAQLVKTDNLAEANACEEDKIKAMMIQSCREYDPINYMTNPWDTPPPSYICFRCGKPGHYIKNCPTNGDKNFKPVARIKKSTGIPRSFMMEAKDPNTKGAMLTKSGTYAIPVINAEAHARGKKEKPPFLPAEPSSSSSTSSSDPVPDELLCLVCKEIMTDAAVVPCCGNSYCDECIRTALLESEEHTCPTCHQADVSPDALIANMFLRKAVNNFSNGTGYTKGLHQTIQQQQQQPPPPPPPLRTVAPPGPFQPVRFLDEDNQHYQVFRAPKDNQCPQLPSPNSQAAFSQMEREEPVLSIVAVSS